MNWDEVTIRTISVPMCDECDQPAEFYVRAVHRNSFIKNIRVCGEHADVWLQRQDPQP